MFKNITVKLKRLGTQESSDEADIQSMNSTSSISFEKSRRSKYSNKFQCKKKLIEQITLETGCDDSLNSPKEKPKNVCFIQDSPFYIIRVNIQKNQPSPKILNFILKVASSEKLEEFKRLYYENPSRLYLKDHRKEWLPIHYAAAKSRIKIIEFILEKSGKSNSKKTFPNPKIQYFHFRHHKRTRPNRQHSAAHSNRKRPFGTLQIPPRQRSGLDHQKQSTALATSLLRGTLEAQDPRRAPLAQKLQRHQPTGRERWHTAALLRLLRRSRVRQSARKIQREPMSTLPPRFFPDTHSRLARLQ